MNEPAEHPGKPYLVTIHAEGDQQHTFAMGPGDAVGVAGIRIDVRKPGLLHRLRRPLTGSHIEIRPNP